MVRRWVRGSKGLQTLEWVALALVVLALIGAVTAWMNGPGGAQVAAPIQQALQRYAWCLEGAGSCPGVGVGSSFGAGVPGGGQVPGVRPSANAPQASPMKPWEWASRCVQHPGNCARDVGKWMQDRWENIRDGLSRQWEDLKTAARNAWTLLDQNRGIVGGIAAASVGVALWNTLRNWKRREKNRKALPRTLSDRKEKTADLIRPHRQGDPHGESERFKKAYSFVLEWEGGYVNHPNDPGGATNMGITQATYNAWRREKGLPTQDVRALTPEEAREIYYQKYWVASGANEITDPDLAMIHFDTAVNMGTERARKFLSKVQEGGHSSPREMVEAYLDLRLNYYLDLCKNKPSQREFLKGWLNRLRALAEAATEDPQFAASFKQKVEQALEARAAKDPAYAKILKEIPMKW
ncbi:glycoside hydrolase family 108 protein [Thermoflexus hugenholtzii]